MKCTHCGNKDPRTLWDEGDTFYCSNCFRRTRTDTGQEDLVTCPYCGGERDSNAYVCRTCGESGWPEDCG